MTEKRQSYAIAGYDVQFPYRPYAPQFALMGKLLTTLEASRAKGNANALLESPTGTGKTLSLLCASLAWQDYYRRNKLKELKRPSISEFHVEGGGFIPAESTEETTGKGGKAAHGRSKAGKSKKDINDGKLPTPKIFYTSRTHSQLSQVVKELKKTTYSPAMAILAARKHYCIHSTVSKEKNADEQCKDMLKDKNRPECSFYKNFHKIRDQESLATAGGNRIHDIEDLIKVGKSVKGCPYFAARSLTQDAEIIFCPYNYILDPVIRRTLDVNIQNSIIIIDEAHNIEDIAREAATFNIELNVLEGLRTELEALSDLGEPYDPIHDMIQGISSWLRTHVEEHLQSGQETISSVWSGAALVKELDKAGLSIQNFSTYLSFCQKAINLAPEGVNDPEGNIRQGLTERSANVLDGLVITLNFMLENDARRLHDYRLVVSRNKHRDEAKKITSWPTTLGLWCMNPAVAFDSLVRSSRSVILTSGTLSPMESFASELGTKFEATMEGSHVVDAAKQRAITFGLVHAPQPEYQRLQTFPRTITHTPFMHVCKVWAGTVSTGPGGVPLNASFKNADDLIFQDSIGDTLLHCCRVIPDGTLVFFPSYKLLEKLMGRWKTTGLWNQLNNLKKIFTEPKSGEDQFEGVLAAYYKTIKRGVEKNAKQKGKTARKGANQEKGAGNKGQSSGALFFAVCRGKVSEGIDFADANARAVVSNTQNH